jgi:hypothetical protein
MHSLHIIRSATKICTFCLIVIQLNTCSKTNIFKKLENANLDICETVLKHQNTTICRFTETFVIFSFMECNLLFVCFYILYLISYIFTSFRNKNDILQLLQNTLYQVLHCESEYTGTLQCVQWFLELLGHTRNISNGVMEISKDVDMTQVIIPEHTVPG